MAELWAKSHYGELFLIVGFEHILLVLISTYILWLSKHRQSSEPIHSTPRNTYRAVDSPHSEVPLCLGKL